MLCPSHDHTRRRIDDDGPEARDIFKIRVTGEARYSDIGPSLTDDRQFVSELLQRDKHLCCSKTTI